jgi:hypothetical protein
VMLSQNVLTLLSILATGTVTATQTGNAANTFTIPSAPSCSGLGLISVSQTSPGTFLVTALGLGGNCTATIDGIAGQSAVLTVHL